MVDPDDDNDGIPDTCIEIDTNGDQTSDYTGLQNDCHRRYHRYQRTSTARHDVSTSTTSAGSGLTVDVTTTGGTVTGVSINRAGSGYAPGDSVAINGAIPTLLMVTTVTSAF